MTFCCPQSPLQALAAKWRVFALLAVAFARLMRRYEDGRVQGAAAPAAELETCLRAAHILLWQDIAGALEGGPPQTAEDEFALDYLRMVACALLMVIFVVQRAAPHLCGAPVWLCNTHWAAAPAAMPARVLEALGFLDSS